MTEQRKLKDYIRNYYFQNNYNCAEAMIRAGNDYYSLGLHEKDMMMVSGYGAGLQSGSTCGALITAVSLLSLRYVEKKAHESILITKSASKMVSLFTEKYHSQLCKEIRPQSFQKEIRCLNTIDTACDILEEVIATYDKERISKEEF